MKIVLNISLCLGLLILVFVGCGKKDQDFKSFLNGHEVVYPGLVTTTSYGPGNLRTALYWHPSTDPSITKYLIYWNNKADSMVVNATSHTPTDSVKVIIPNLLEYVYTFTVYSLDAKGNRSIPLDISNVRVYGPVYQSRLLNRAYDPVTPYVVNANGSVTLNFSAPDTINISTDIRYTNTSGTVVEKPLAPTANSITLTDYKSGTTVQYRSSYIPVKSAIDVFTAPQYSDFPQIFSLVQCDKSLFAKVKLPNDMNPYEGDTDIDRLWDGSVGPQGFPNIFHSDGAHALPQVLTFDMGKIYNNLAQVEETGRNCCHNPNDYEIWGIASLTGATTTLQPNDSGWPAEAVAKGWTLLQEVNRSDDGQAALKSALIANPPPVRYIRIRIKHNTDNEGSYTNLSEITLWNKQ